MTSRPTALLVDMWSDFMCPFCYIGKRRLEVALKGLGFEVRDAGNGRGLPAGHESVDARVAYVRFRAYELDPNCPPVKPMGIVPHLAMKYGMPEAAAVAKCEGMARAGQSVGLDFTTVTCASQTRLMHTVSFTMPKRWARQWR